MSHLCLKRLATIVCIGASVLSFAGCTTTISSGSETTPGAVFAGRSTFRFLPDKSQPDPTTPNWRGVISQDILAALNIKRYRFFPLRKTDLLVGFHIVLAENENVQTMDSYLGYPVTAGPAAQGDLSRFQDPKRPGAASQGLLVIDFIDPKKNMLLWRGWAKTRLRPKMSQERFQEESKEAVNKILATFPGAAPGNRPHSGPPRRGGRLGGYHHH
ncbi:MAG TPA: DUF4136 domain-containing protein [Chthoniobacterales bacterium]|jgi:hypothetical protein|nr:DUF4136 domain-containing protein [Chthoniobacterales bacterium]